MYYFCSSLHFSLVNYCAVKGGELEKNYGCSKEIDNTYRPTLVVN